MVSETKNYVRTDGFQVLTSNTVCILITTIGFVGTNDIRDIFTISPESHADKELDFCDSLSQSKWSIRISGLIRRKQLKEGT